MPPVVCRQSRVFYRRAFLWVSLLLFLVASAIVWSSCGDDADPASSWTLPADTASLSELWSRAASNSGNPDLSDAELTSFMGLWNGDGTIHKLQLQARTTAGTELTIWAETPAGTDTTVVWSGSMNYPKSRTSNASSGPVPTAPQVLATIDTVTVEGLASAASIAVTEGEFLTLWLNHLSSPPEDPTLDEAFPGGAHYGIEDGSVSSLDGGSRLSSLGSYQHFYFAVAKRNWDGGIQGGVNDSIVNVFAR